MSHKKQDSNILETKEHEEKMTSEYSLQSTSNSSPPTAPNASQASQLSHLPIFIPPGMQIPPGFTLALALVPTATAKPSAPFPTVAPSSVSSQPPTAIRVPEVGFRRHPFRYVILTETLRGDICTQVSSADSGVAAPPWKFVFWNAPNVSTDTSDASSNSPGGDTKKRKSNAQQWSSDDVETPLRCESCGIELNEGDVRRRGPGGTTVCNPCGLRYYRSVKKHTDENAITTSSSVPTPTPTPIPTPTSAPTQAQQSSSSHSKSRRQFTQQQQSPSQRQRLRRATVGRQASAPTLEVQTSQCRSETGRSDTTASAATPAVISLSVPNTARTMSPVSNSALSSVVGSSSPVASTIASSNMSVTALIHSTGVNASTSSRSTNSDFDTNTSGAQTAQLLMSPRTFDMFEATPQSAPASISSRNGSVSFSFGSLRRPSAASIIPNPSLLFNELPLSSSESYRAANDSESRSGSFVISQEFLSFFSSDQTSPNTNNNPPTTNNQGNEK